MASSPPNNDVVTQILLHLPLHTLFRFRKVSKFWADIIHSPSFQKSHILHHSNNNNNDNDEDDTQVLVHFHYDRGWDSNIPDSSIMLLDTGKYEDSYFPDLRRRRLNRLKTAPGSIVTELRDAFRYVELVIGPVNGLLCIYSGCHNGGITVYNPSLGQTRKLPPHQTCPIPHQTCDVGIGFDDVAHDYKVVQLQSCLEHVGNYVLHVSVYSRATDSWRDLADVAEYFHIKEPLKSTRRDGGVVRWLATRTTRGLVVLSFDMKSEVFRIFELPDDTNLPHFGVSEVIMAKGDTTFVLFICDSWKRLNIYEARFEGEGNNLVRWDFVKRIKYGGRGARPKGLWRNDCVVFHPWSDMKSSLYNLRWRGIVNDYDPWGLNIHGFKPLVEYYESGVGFFNYCDDKTIMDFEVPAWCHYFDVFEYQGSFVSP